jgi:hydrogenase maturation protein HypF
MKREIVTLTGFVQGVGFRDRVVRKARRYPVSGTVRNRLDRRRLEIDVEGPEQDVDAFIDEVLADPPSTARVERVERLPVRPRGTTGFAEGSTY